MAFTTIPEMFLELTQKFEANPAKYAFMRKVNGTYQGITYAALREMVESFAVGLLELGIERGDRVGIVSENRLEWVVADFATAAIGAVNVPVFPTLTHKQIEYIYNNCSTSCIIVSNSFQLNKVLKIASELRALEHIIVMNDDAAFQPGMIRSFKDVTQLGATKFSLAERREMFLKNSAAVQQDDLLTLIYTSGTTGNPKGVMLTHKNIASNIQGMAAAIEIRSSDLLLCYLPMCHAYERTTGYYTAFAVGATIAFAESIETVAENLREVQPTIVTSVPRLFERIKGRVLASVEKDKPAKQKIFNWAMEIGRAYQLGLKNGHVSGLLKTKQRLADKLVFSKIRARTGGKIRFFASGGAALPLDVAEFFKILGIEIIEGYGLTEASPVLAANRIGQPDFGTVGKPLDNVEIIIADDGEILARGPNIMKGYWKEAQATAESIDEDGWLHTGDIGLFNEKGNLKITDRKKHLFISSGGKNISPQPIEQLMTSIKYVDQCLLIGDKREYCTALLVPDFDVLHSYAEANGIPFKDNEDLVQNPKIYELFKTEIDNHQRDLAKYERVRKFTLLPEAFTVENGGMTPTLKIKRKEVEKKFSEIIEKMYS
ncbi:MAG TPA: long-chain fatty acid--CoA ligase [Patescibacteria group bacterium]|nr:long-chain fatty acid--CoA ligase [Patescibacteria group bacterium]